MADTIPKAFTVPLVEYTRLATERDALKIQAAVAVREKNEALAERDRLAAELSAARADAERYRWLRSFAGRTPELPDFDEPKSPEHMDAMIDAARATPSAEGN